MATTKKAIAKSPTHILQDQDQIDAITKRMKRAQGQMGAVVRMLEEGRNCEDVVTQLAAVNKAVTTAGFTLISSIQAVNMDDIRKQIAEESAQQKIE
jgi:DNA-binding FrmR family transcriptional regulator